MERLGLEDIVGNCLVKKGEKEKKKGSMEQRGGTLKELISFTPDHEGIHIFSENALYW